MTGTSITTNYDECIFLHILICDGNHEEYYGCSDCEGVTEPFAVTREAGNLPPSVQVAWPRPFYFLVFVLFLIHGVLVLPKGYLRSYGDREVSG